MLINLLEGVEPLFIPLAVIALCLCILAAILLKVFWFDNKFLTSKERKIIEHKEGKVIEIYGYKPQPGSVKIFNGQAVD